MTRTAPHRRLIVGAMTGTSMDGIDAVLTEITGTGLQAHGRVLGHAHGPLAPLRDALTEIACGTQVHPDLLAGTARDLGIACGAAMRAACGDHVPDLAIVHGQTVLHAPPRTWQVIDPNLTAEAVGCPVAYDLRRGDLAAGGRGAPITPLGDWVLLRTAAPRAVVNLGGFCNITWLPADGGPDCIDDIAGCDVCACNQLLDAVARAHLDASFDAEGAAAASGRDLPAAADALRAMLHAQALSGRALGPGDEAVQWLAHPTLDAAAPADIAATATHAVGRTIADALGRHPCEDILVAGGGARHAELMRTIARHAPAPVVPTSQVGLDIEAREAACLCALATLDRDGNPATLPGITGRRSDVPVRFRWTDDADQTP